MSIKAVGKVIFKNVCLCYNLPYQRHGEKFGYKRDLEVSKSFVKREGILLLACVLAVSSSLAVVPKAEYIDWRVLVFIILPDVSCRRV